jgi:hypothetical protein
MLDTFYGYFECLSCVSLLGYISTPYKQSITIPKSPKYGPYFILQLPLLPQKHVGKHMPYMDGMGNPILPDPLLLLFVNFLLPSRRAIFCRPHREWGTWMKTHHT